MLDSSDAELVKRAQGGDVNAIGELYDRHHERIFRYLWSRTHDSGSADDLTGEVFTRMVTNLSDYRSRGVPFKAWLYRIARNLLIDHYRKQERHPAVPLDHAAQLTDESHNPVALVEQQLTLERVQAALEELDPSQREVVILRFLAGLSLKEVAATLDKTVAAVKSLQHRGLVHLRVTLQQE